MKSADNFFDKHRDTRHARSRRVQTAREQPIRPNDPAQTFKSRSAARHSCPPRIRRDQSAEILFELFKRFVEMCFSLIEDIIPRQGRAVPCCGL